MDLVDTAPYGAKDYIGNAVLQTLRSYGAQDTLICVDTNALVAWSFTLAPTVAINVNLHGARPWHLFRNALRLPGILMYELIVDKVETLWQQLWKQVCRRK